MLAFKKKIVIHHLFLLVFFIIWSSFFYFKWLVFAWLLFPVIPLFGYLTNPIPSADRFTIRHSKFCNISLIILSVVALVFAFLNFMVSIDMSPKNKFTAILDKIDSHGSFVVIVTLILLIPVVVSIFREEIKYAIKADEEVNVKRGVN
ncbi:MAG: hypothetical protein ABSB11_01125 [Sedimentisphaerales bacterium]